MNAILGISLSADPVVARQAGDLSRRGPFATEWH